MKDVFIGKLAIVEDFRKLKEEKKDIFVGKQEHLHIKCPGCRNGNNKEIYKNSCFVYKECMTCGLIFLSKRPLASETRDYYEISNTNNYYQKEIIQKTISRRKKTFNEHLNYIEKFAHKGKLLDLGASIGIFTEMANARGWKAEGVELNKYAWKYAKQKGLSIFNYSLEECAFGSASYDVVTGWEFISHLTEPYTIIEEAFRILVPGGLIFLSTPNVRGYDYLVLGNNHPTIGYTYLNLFDETSIKIMLEKIGFIDIEVHAKGRLDVQIVSNALRNGTLYEMDGFWKEIYSGQNKHRKFLEDFQKLITSRGLSGHMVIKGRVPIGK